MTEVDRAFEGRRFAQLQRELASNPNIASKTRITAVEHITDRIVLTALSNDKDPEVQRAAFARLRELQTMRSAAPDS